MSPSEFERQANEHLPSLVGFAARLTRNRAEAEDLVQEALLKAFRARDQFRDGTNARAWLLRIVRNTFLNAYRRRGLERQWTEGPSAEALGNRLLGAATVVATQGEEGRRLHPALEEKVLAAIDELPVEFRMAVLLADVEELSYKEIADALDCPIGTVMSRLHRGRRMLRSGLAEHAVDLGIAQDHDGSVTTRALPGNEPVDLETYRKKKGAVS